MTLTVNITAAKRMALKGMMAGLVPMLWGPPAIGKSAIIQQIADENNLFLIDERLSDCDPTDLKGFPFFDPTTGKAGYRPMEQYPVEGDKLPIKTKQYNVGDVLPDGTKATKIIPATHYDGWLLFLDELTNADDDVRKAAYKLILDRMVGQKKLHENVAIVCAGNGIQHGAMAHELGTALQSRLFHIDVELSFDAWKTWAISKQVDQRILDYLNFTGGSKLYTFNPDHTDKTFAAPRTWMFVDRYIKTHGFDKDADPDLFMSIAGLISDGVAAEFMQFCTVYRTLPTMDEIMSGPEYARIPQDLSAVFAIAGAVASAMNLKNADTLLKYIRRLPSEFLIVTIMDAAKRDKTLNQNRQIREWAMANGHEYF